MLTNPTTSSTSVSSSSLVEVTSSTFPSSASPSSVPLSAAASQETTVVPTQNNLGQSQTPVKRRKKSAKANSGADPAPVAAVSGGLALSGAPPLPGNGNDKNGTKRSRKQKIDTLRNVCELSPFPEKQSVPEKSGGKRRKGPAPKDSAKNVSDLVPVSGSKKGKNVNKNNVTKSRASTTGLLRKTSKKSTSATTTTASELDNSVVSYDPQQKIVLKRSEFIDPNLSFTIFPDLTRGLGAIGPSQVVISVESTREPGTREELISDSCPTTKSPSSLIEFKCQQLSLFLSVPHFLPLQSVYSSGEPFARILRFSALEQYTQGVLARNQVSSFRFYGTRYETQVPSISSIQEKDSRIVQLRKRIPNPNAYPESLLIIKHPVLGFYSRKLVSLKFVILKKIDFENTVIGHLKAKIVQLRRSADLKNIEIYVDESRVPEEVSDVNAMNQHNIQPVIQTPSGLVPVITRTPYQAQHQEYQIEQPPHQQAETQFQYVQYHYQTASDLVQEISASNSGTSNLILNLDNVTGEYFGSTPTFRDETGAQVLILSPSDDASSFISHHQQPQQHIIHQQQEPANFYANQEQQIVIQQHQPYSPQQLQQQQQTYTIQPQQGQQQIIQIQPPEPPKEGEVRRQSRYILLPGTDIPIEIQFETPAPQQTNPVVETARVYTQPEQLQVQVQPQQQFRSGQQIVVQQPQTNQFQVQQHLQVPQQQLTSPQTQVVIRQQQQNQFVQSNTGTTAQAYQYGNATQQQQQQVIVQQSTQQTLLHQQQPQQHQQQQVLSTCVQQAHHHQAQLNQLQGVQQSSPIRFQPVQQQQQTQPLLHSQVQPRPQLIQQHTATSLQSPPSAAPASATSLYQQQQRPPFPQQAQPPQQQQQSQFIPAGGPLSSSIPQAVPPSKQKKPKQTKKNAKGAVTNQVPANLSGGGDLLSPQQLEQLRQREQKRPGYQSPPQAIPPPGGVKPGIVSPSYAVPPPVSSSLIRPVVPPQQPQVLHFNQHSTVPIRKTTPGQAPPRTRPPAPPPPIISSSTSLACFPSVSSGTSPVRQPVAPKSHNPSAPSATTPLSSLAVSSTTSTAVALSPEKKSPKSLIVVPSPTPPVTSAGGASAAHKQEFKSKPGHLAVCPHCGVGNKNILRCNRCKHELPADVKFIKDEWEVNKGGAAVAVPVAKGNSTTTSTPTTTTVSASSDTNSKAVALPSTGKSKSVVGGRKILLVNKPQAPVPAIQGNSSVVKTIVAPGTVHVQIQPDGGSAVTINSGGVSVVQTKPAPVVTKPAKRRAPARKRQAHECITLSSDDEEPEPPKAKVAKQEVKPADNTASTVEAATKEASTDTKPVVPASVVSSTTTTTTTPTSTTSGTGVTASTLVQQGKVELSAVVSKEEQTVTTSAVTTTAATDTNMQKQFKINLSEGPGPSKAEPENVSDPNTVFAKIEEEMGKVAGRFQYATLTCRSIRVGSYKVTSADTGFSIPVLLTELGLKFTLPFANYKRKNVKICIPMESILNINVHLHKRLQVLFITTGPKFAIWIRQALGLDGNPKNESSNYYCPVEGLLCQKTITLVGENVEEADVGIVKKLYSNVLHELEYAQANDFLMRITPQSFRSSMGFNSNNSPDPSPGPRIVSTTSMANASVPSPPGSSISTASTVIIPKRESLSSGNNDKDSEGVILFYEGRNNIKVPICPNDIKCLTYAQFLNDQIIDFWLAVIQTEILSEEDKSRTFVFDSFFYSKLTEKMKRKNEEDGNLTAGERRHGRVKKRTKNVDIFSKDFLIVPINENYHWFIAIICFPGIEGYHDYNTMEPLPNYKRPRTTSSKSGSSTTNNNKKPLVYNQPKSDTTASFSNRDEAPEDPEEMSPDQISSPDTPETDGSESKSQVKTETGEPIASEKADKVTTGTGTKRKSEFSQSVKHPCILIFDSLAGDARGRIYSTLREYLRIEYKTKKNVDRVFDKNTIPGAMPKVPQQPNFSDCGLFMLQYVESFFSQPIPTYETKDINLKTWFPQSIAENKRREIYDFIKKRVDERCPQNASRIPDVRFEPNENDLQNAEEEKYKYALYDDDGMYDDDEDYEEESEISDEEEFNRHAVANAKKPGNSKDQQSTKKASSDSDDHNYATTPPKTSATAALAASLPSPVVSVAKLRATSDTTINKKNT